MAPEARIKTTVVVPVWDDYAGATLNAALGSLNEQAVPFSLMLVDNASSVTVPIVRQAQQIRSDARVSVGAARNLGLAQVTTPYVVFWDADDEMLPGALERLQREMEADPGLVLFGMAIREQPSGLRHRWPRRYLPRLASLPRLLRLIEPVWAQFPTTGATIIRTEAAKRAGGFADADSGEDWCLGVSLAFRGRIGWTEEPGRVYRLHPKSMWAQHLTLHHQRRHAAAVRQRLRADPAVPGWVRLAMPAVWTLQQLALIAHAAVAGARRSRTRSD